MNGGLIFSGKLLTYLNFPLEASYLHATRYRNETSGGDLFWKAKPEVSFIDRDVLIIDDILDEGHTLGAIIDFCKQAGARKVHTAVLLDKDHDRNEIGRATSRERVGKDVSISVGAVQLKK